MSYTRDSHDANTRRIASLLKRGTKPPTIAKKTKQTVARVELVRVVVQHVKDGHGTDTIAVVLGVSKGTVRRVRAALGIAATKADGARMTNAGGRGAVVSAIAAKCDRCGGLRGNEEHGASDCARTRRAVARYDEQRAIDRFDAMAEFDQW